ncbi:hypothetical protein Tco_1399138, partial [Tanacetum coccineum]
VLLSARYNSGLFVDSLHVSKFGYGTWFPESKGSGVGRGVKEKQQANGCDYSLGNGGAPSFSDATHTSSNGSTSSSGDATNTQLPTANIAVTDTLGNSIVNKKDNLHDENDGMTPSKSTTNPSKGTFYANLFTDGLSRKAMNFPTLFTPTRNGVDVVVSIESISAISEQFANTTCGFFLGKRVAYPVVANYVGTLGVNMDW